MLFSQLYSNALKEADTDLEDLRRAIKSLLSLKGIDRYKHADSVTDDKFDELFSVLKEVLKGKYPDKVIKDELAKTIVNMLPEGEVEIKESSIEDKVVVFGGEGSDFGVFDELDADEWKEEFKKRHIKVLDLSDDLIFTVKGKLKDIYDFYNTIVDNGSLGTDYNNIEEFANWAGLLNESIEENKETQNIDYILNRYDDLDMIDKENLGNDSFYQTLVTSMSEVKEFNFHSDYWGSEDEYQEKAEELMSDIEPYIGKIVEYTIPEENETYKVKINGIYIDKQYNSHLKLAVDWIMNEAEEVKESKRDLPSISKFVYDLDDEFNNWSVQDYTNNANGQDIIIVSRNGKSNLSAEDIISKVEEAYPQLKGEATINGRSIWFYLRSQIKDSEEDNIPVVKDEDRELYDKITTEGKEVYTSQDGKIQDYNYNGKDYRLSLDDDMNVSISIKEDEAPKEDFETKVYKDFQKFLNDNNIKAPTEKDINDYFTGLFYDIETEEDLDDSNRAEELIRNKYLNKD